MGINDALFQVFISGRDVRDIVMEEEILVKGPTERTLCINDTVGEIVNQPFGLGRLNKIIAYNKDHVDGNFNIRLGIDYTAAIVVEEMDASATFLDDVTDLWTFPSHSFSSGDSFQLVVTAGDPFTPTGLAALTTYYVKVIDGNTIEVYTNAGLTAKVDILALGTAGDTFTLTTIVPSSYDINLPVSRLLWYEPDEAIAPYITEIGITTDSVADINVDFRLYGVDEATLT